MDLTDESQDLWNEVTAERSGEKPVKSAAKPTQAPAVTVETPVDEAKPDPVAELNKRIAELEKGIGERLRNAEGHIGSLNGVQRQMKEKLEAATAAASNTNNAPSQSEIKQAASDPKEWAELKKDYPEWADATEKIIDARVAVSKPNFDATAFENSLKQQLKGESEAMRKEIIDAALDAVFPGYEEEVRSEPFKTWFAGQPANIQALSASDKVGDAARMLRLYDQSKQSAPETKVIEQRKQTLANATATPKGIRTASTQKSPSDMTAEELWDYEKRQRAKRSQG